MWSNHLVRRAGNVDVDNCIQDFDVAIVPIKHVVVDLDVKKGEDGIAFFRALGDCPPTMTVATPSGGRHLWFRYDGDLTSCNCGHGVEFKRLTSNVHVPPSTNYEWLHKIAPIPLPNWALDFWKESRKSTPKLVKENKFNKGLRHDALKTFAAVAKQYLYLNDEEMLSLLIEVNDQRCDPPLPYREVECISLWASNLDSKGIEVGALHGDQMNLYLSKLIYA